jgi:hypothetical protein
MAGFALYRTITRGKWAVPKILATLGFQQRVVRLVSRKDHWPRSLSGCAILMTRPVIAMSISAIRRRANGGCRGCAGRSAPAVDSAPYCSAIRDDAVSRNRAPLSV